MPREHLSRSQARRLALGAQGFHRQRPSGRVDQRHLVRAMDEMGVIQIDSVNSVARSQDLVLFSRLGPHRASLIPDATRQGRLFEYWVHEASHVPTADHRLYRWRMQQPSMWSGLARLRDEHPELLDEVLAIVTDRGPLVASDLGMRDRPKQPWWDWDDGKAALEVLFHQGRVAATRRQSDFARVYDLTERVIPASVLAEPTPTAQDARRELVARAARSLGVSTVADLADYHRQPRREVAPLVDDLVEDGLLLPVAVEGWPHDGYVPAGVSIPRNIDRVALLSPFDPIVWNRARASRLFDFEYRIEIYTPKSKRRYGYYVMPLLVGERIVARVDLKADRKAGVLRAISVWLEPGADPFTTRTALDAELDLMAEWLGLERVEHGGGGDLG